jgi:hypothetical protein
MEIEKIIRHIRDREYMSGIERGQSRVNITNEIFTPTARAIIDVHKLPVGLFIDPNKTFQDQCCGDGQFLGEVLIRKLEQAVAKREWYIESEEAIGNYISDQTKKEWFWKDFEQALSTIYGVDLMIDNVDLCRERLLCGQEHLRHIVERNIVCHDALTYDYSFNGTNSNQDDLNWNNLFEFA